MEEQNLISVLKGLGATDEQIDEGLRKFLRSDFFVEVMLMPSAKALFGGEASPEDFLKSLSDALGSGFQDDEVNQACTMAFYEAFSEILANQ